MKRTESEPNDRRRRGKRAELTTSANGRASDLDEYIGRVYNARLGDLVDADVVLAVPDESLHLSSTGVGELVAIVGGVGNVLGRRGEVPEHRLEGIGGGVHVGECVVRVQAQAASSVASSPHSRLVVMPPKIARSVTDQERSVCT